MTQTDDYVTRQMMLQLRQTTATVAEMASQTDDVTVTSEPGRLRWTQLQETV